MADDGRLADALAREPLSANFERRRVILAPGTARPTEAAEWAGAIVLVEAGVIEVECLGGGRRSFAEGDLLALGWLPLKTLRNVGTSEARVLAVRRRGPAPNAEYLHVTRRTRTETGDDT